MFLCMHILFIATVSMFLVAMRIVECHHKSHVYNCLLLGIKSLVPTGQHVHNEANVTGASVNQWSTHRADR